MPHFTQFIGSTFGQLLLIIILVLGVLSMLSARSSLGKGVVFLLIFVTIVGAITLFSR